jgi:spermidine/putrescine transport system substrate-binding protein
MKSFKIPVIIVTTLSFASGIWWGLKIQRDHLAAAGRVQSDVVLHVLAYRSALPVKLIRSYQAKNNVRVELTEVDSVQELWEKLKAATATGNADVATVFSDQAELAAGEGWLESLSEREIPELRNIHPDFLPIPSKPQSGRVAPILWGATGFAIDSEATDKMPQTWRELLNLSDIKDRLFLLSWPPLPLAMDPNLLKVKTPWQALRERKSPPPHVVIVHHGETAFTPFKDSSWRFVLPRDGAPLWTLSLVIGKNSVNKSEAAHFVAFALQPELALETVRSSKQASTNRALENEKIDAKLKPHFLRQLNLTALKSVKAPTNPTK